MENLLKIFFFRSLLCSLEVLAPPIKCSIIKLSHACTKNYRTSLKVTLMFVEWTLICSANGFVCWYFRRFALVKFPVQLCCNLSCLLCLLVNSLEDVKLNFKKRLSYLRSLHVMASLHPKLLLNLPMMTLAQWLHDKKSCMFRAHLFSEGMTHLFKCWDRINLFHWPLKKYSKSWRLEQEKIVSRRGIFNAHFDATAFEMIHLLVL